MIELPKPKSHIRIGCQFAKKELSKLSDKAQLTYLWLLVYRSPGPNGGCYPSQKLLAEHMHCSRWTIIRALDELESNGLVSREKSAVVGKNNYYYIHSSV